MVCCLIVLICVLVWLFVGYCLLWVCLVNGVDVVFVVYILLVGGLCAWVNCSVFYCMF